MAWSRSALPIMTACTRSGADSRRRPHGSAASMPGRACEERRLPKTRPETRPETGEESAGRRRGVATVFGAELNLASARSAGATPATPATPPAPAGPAGPTAQAAPAGPPTQAGPACLTRRGSICSCWRGGLKVTAGCARKYVPLTSLAVRRASPTTTWRSWREPTTGTGLSSLATARASVPAALTGGGRGALTGRALRRRREGTACAY